MGKRILVVGSTTYHMRRWFHYVTPLLHDDIIVDMYTSSNGATADMFEGANKVFFTKPTPFYLRPLLFVPKIRGMVMMADGRRTMREILEEEKYDAINIHQLNLDAYGLAKLARNKGLKIILTPWGSDVLRCPWYLVGKIKKLFQIANKVTYNLEGFSQKYIKKYNVPPQKMFFAGFGSEIFDLIPKFKGKLTKKELAKEVGIPEADYYITCGYMADHAQRHKLMIDAIGANKEFVPKNTILLFPFTYGDGRNEDYMSELRGLCESYGLKCHFITEYLTNEQMAMFRCLADLFIHIQPTDAASASLAEYLLANVQVINGKWLDYPHLEKDGMPYIICENLESLQCLVKSFFEGNLQKRYISDSVREELMKGAWSNQKLYWKKLFCEI